MMKKEKGITLIALIITIIVMLILVIVTINIAMNGGLFSKARKTSTEMQKQADREELYIAVVSAYNEKTGQVDFDKLKQELGDRWEAEGDSLPCAFTKIETGNSFVVYEDGTIGEAEDTSTDFDIELSIFEKQENSTRIKMTADTSKLVTQRQIYDKLNQMIGLEGENLPTSQTVTAIYTLLKGTEKSYSDVKSELSTQYNVDNPTDDELVLMMVFAENYSNYTLLDIVGTISYEATNKSISVYKEDGTEISYSNLEWDGNDAIFTVTEYGNLKVKVDFDGKKAIGYVRATHVDPVGDFIYEYDEEHKTAMVAGLSETGLAKLQNGPIELPIPETVIHEDEEYTVIGIKDGAFNTTFTQASNLIITSLPSSITTIGDNAFYNCTNLALTELPDGLTEIGDYAFYNCTNLALTELPENVVRIGMFAFYNCTNLALTELPDGITEISSAVFTSCTNLALTKLPDGITEIGWHAFYNCTNLALTELPESVTTIGDDAFSDCRNITISKLPDNLEYIANAAFDGCSGITISRIPDGIGVINSFTFSGCTGITTLTLPEHITSIRIGGFSGCTNLQLDHLPSSLQRIEQSAFENCTSLAITEIPSHVSIIQQKAFKGCSSITTIQISSNVSTMENEAFNCPNLTDVYVPTKTSKPSSWPYNWVTSSAVNVHWGESMP